MGRFPKMVIPKMKGLYWKIILLKWMIVGTHHFRKPPILVDCKPSTAAHHWCPHRSGQTDWRTAVAPGACVGYFETINGAL